MFVYTAGSILRWTWDERKARSNLEKHGVAFEIAVHVFEDPFHLTEPDPHPDEERWRTIGRPFPERLLILFVVHTDEDGDGGRIISAPQGDVARKESL